MTFEQIAEVIAEARVGDVLEVEPMGLGPKRVRVVRVDIARMGPKLGLDKDIPVKGPAGSPAKAKVLIVVDSSYKHVPSARKFGRIKESYGDAYIQLTPTSDDRLIDSIRFYDDDQLFKRERETKYVTWGDVPRH